MNSNHNSKNDNQIRKSIDLQSTYLTNFRKFLAYHIDTKSSIPSLNFTNCNIEIEHIQLILSNKHLFTQCTNLVLCNIPRESESTHTDHSDENNSGTECICLQYLFDLLSKVCINFQKVYISNVYINDVAFVSMIKFLKNNRVEDLVIKNCGVNDREFTIFCNR